MALDEHIRVLVNKQIRRLTALIQNEINSKQNELAHLLPTEITKAQTL